MNARSNILQRLRKRRDGQLPMPELDFSPMQGREWNAAEKLDRFQQTIESVHGEVHRVTEDDWLDRLAELLQSRGARNLLVAERHRLGRKIRESEHEGLPPLLAYDQPIEAWQETLFHDVDAAITSTRGAIAETGTLILWPTPDEPRLMSLVPPVHIAVLEADQIYATFLEALHMQRWSSGMPTNALLVSGPSKTADIEQTLAYGVHGPKELIVLVIQ
ncbi:MAG: lactate utilization protein [Marinobacter sp.]|uniref:LutC/YkgG family protein n=1 Tax=Marinobacter sp. TaxID=50741 RepID=UPI00299EDC3C|nr:lactate utilization protein [Marinobacter sp.]MDX1634671.1 lactate utilization protein [Marinobacter sp.]